MKFFQKIKKIKKHKSKFLYSYNNKNIFINRMLIINKDTTDLDYQIITQIEKVKQQQEVKIRAFNHDI